MRAMKKINISQIKIIQNIRIIPTHVKKEIIEKQ